MQGPPGQAAVAALRRLSSIIGADTRGTSAAIEPFLLLPSTTVRWM